MKLFDDRNYAAFFNSKDIFLFFKLRKSGNFIRWAGMHLRNVFLCLIAAGRG